MVVLDPEAHRRQQLSRQKAQREAQRRATPGALGKFARRAPTIDSGRATPQLTERDPTRIQPGVTVDLLGQPNQPIQRPTQLGTGTFFNNEFNLSENQLNVFEGLINQGVSQDIALTQARGAAVRTPGEGIRDFFANAPGAAQGAEGTVPTGPALFGRGMQGLGTGISNLAEAAAGTDEQFFMSQASQRADQLALIGSAREQFISREVEQLREDKRTDLRAVGGRGTGATRTRPQPAETDQATAQEELMERARQMDLENQMIGNFNLETNDLYLAFVSGVNNPDGSERLPPDQLLGASFDDMLSRIEDIWGPDVDAAELFGYPPGTSMETILIDLGYVQATEDSNGMWILPDPPIPPSAGGSAGGFGFTGGGGGGRGGGGRSVGRGIGAGVSAGLFLWRITA